MEKTNVMRILSQRKIEYEAFCYEEFGYTNGMDVANFLKEDPNKVFKTLVTIGHSRTYYVFMVPVCLELNLKKAAISVGEKSIEMIKSKDLLPLTGYVHGGCSPIGMKKPFKTTINKTAEDYEKIYFSAGKIGYQVKVSLKDLQSVIPVQTADIVD